MTVTSSLCEIAVALIFPILYGLQYFNAVGLKAPYEANGTAVDCFATAGSLTPVPGSGTAAGLDFLYESNYVNVSSRFATVIALGWWASLINLVVVLPAFVYFQRKGIESGDPKAIPGPVVCGSSTVALVMFVQMIMIFVYRGSSTGYTCSGWNMTDADRANPALQKYVEFGKGEFLFAMMILNSVVLALGCCACCVGTLVLASSGTHS